jgi:hypothetical protein
MGHLRCLTNLATSEMWIFVFLVVLRIKSWKEKGITSCFLGMTKWVGNLSCRGDTQISKYFLCVRQSQMKKKICDCDNIPSRGWLPYA